MTREPSGRRRRCGLLCIVLLFCLPAAGCSLFMDEFTWLDRAPPPAENPADFVSGP